MIPKPITRDQARQNAILAAEEAHLNARGGTPQQWALVSQAWSDIAQTFPYDEPETYEVRGDDATIYTVPFEVTASERETLVQIREGSLTTVHPDYVLEHMALVRSQFRTEPGYVGMAVTAEEQRTIMAMRSGDPREATTQTLPVIPVVAPSDVVRVTQEFYLVLIAMAEGVLSSNLADDGVATIYPEDIERAKEKSIVMTEETNPASWKVWIEEPGT